MRTLKKMLTKQIGKIVKTVKMGSKLGAPLVALSVLGALQATAMSSDAANTAVQNDIGALPEPSAALLFAAGIAVLAFTQRRARS